MLDNSYIAGLFDGEGTVSLSFLKRRIQKTDPTKSIYGYKMQVALSNTYLPVLEALKKQFAGNICNHAARPQNPHHKQIWSWHLQAAAIQRRFLVAVEPHVLIKQEHVKLGLEYLKTVVSPGKRLSQNQWDKRREILAQFRKLNQRGGIEPPRYTPSKAAPTGLRPSEFYSDADLAARMELVRSSKR